MKNKTRKMFRYVFKELAQFDTRINQVKSESRLAIQLLISQMPPDSIKINESELSEMKKSEVWRKALDEYPGLVLVTPSEKLFKAAKAEMTFEPSGEPEKKVDFRTAGLFVESDNYIVLTTGGLNNEGEFSGVVVKQKTEKATPVGYVLDVWDSDMFSLCTEPVILTNK